MSKLDTKTKLINTTIEIIARDGLEEATAGNIAEKGELNKSLIFYHFDNLDNLLKSALVSCVKRISPILKKDFDQYENIKDYLYNSISKIINNSNNLIYLRVILSFAHQNTYLNNDLKELRLIIIDDLYEILVEAVNYYKEIELTYEEIDTIASLIMTTFNGLGVVLLLDKSNEKFMRNWKLQAELIERHIKKH